MTDLTSASPRAGICHPLLCINPVNSLRKINLSCVWPLLFLSSSDATHLSLSEPLVSVHCRCGATRKRWWGREGGNRMAAGPCRASNTGGCSWQLTKANTAQWCYTARWTGGQAGLQGGGRKLPDCLHDVWQLCKPQYMKQSLSDKGKEGMVKHPSHPQASAPCYELPHMTSTSSTLQLVLACVWKPQLSEWKSLSQHWEPGQASWGKSLNACMFPVSGCLHQLCLRASVDPAAAFHFHL